MQRARDRVVAACHLIRSSAACYSDAAKKPAAFGTGSEISFTRCSPHVVVNSLVSSSSASQAYIDRFRGAPSHEVPRIIPRRHPRDKNPVTFGSALMESLLQSSAMLHCADAVTTKPEPVVFNVLKTVRVLQEKNVATERSIALHAAFIERMVQTNQPQMFECVQYHYATLASPNAKIWRLPLTLQFVTMSTAFIDSVQKQTAGHSISTLNESLVSAVPELSTGALVAPYAWVSHEAWAVVAALTFVLRTIAAYMQQNPTRVLDQIGQKGIPVESGFARTAFEGAADVVTLCLLALPFIHPSVELAAVSTMLLLGMSTMGENIAPYNTKPTIHTAQWYADEGRKIEEQHMTGVMPVTLETRLLHALQLADAIRATAASASSSKAPQEQVACDKRPLERIWAAPPIGENDHERLRLGLRPSRGPYVAADAITDKGWFTISLRRCWGWTEAVMSLGSIAGCFPWLADDELALEAASAAWRSGTRPGTMHEELLLERALVALSAAVAASKDQGRLVAAPLLAPGAGNQEHEWWQHLVRLVPEPQMVEAGREIGEAVFRALKEGKPDGKFTLEEHEEMSFTRKHWRVREHLAEHLQSQEGGFRTMLLAVDTLVGALKPMKSDVAPLHYHAGVVWFNGARAMKSPSKLSGAVEEAEAVEAPLPPQERREIERAVESDPKKIASIFDDSASSKVEQRDSSTGELKPDDGLLDDPHQAREQLAIERMEQSIDEDYNREEAREKARKQFLQQACKHFRAAQRSCLLKNVEMRGRISKSLGYTLVELEEDPVGALQALLRAARCLPRDVTLLEDVQQVWNSEDCQASLSQLAALEPERVAVLREDTACALSILKGLAPDRPQHRYH